MAPILLILAALTGPCSGPTPQTECVVYKGGIACWRYCPGELIRFGEVVGTAIKWDGDLDGDGDVDLRDVALELQRR